MKKDVISIVLATGSILSFCPYCDSDKVWRILRTETEKIACFLSQGKYMAKKYLCQSCQRTILRPLPQTSPTNAITINEDRIEGLVACIKCGLQNLRVGKVPVSEENTYHAETGKTAFRKTTCLGCCNENIISNEDFENFNKQEF
jgi:ribosomal protein S27E